MQHHQAGRLREAETLYRQVLQARPDDANALHCLGILALQTGQADAAVALIGKAVLVNPNSADFHNNLGNAFIEQGRIEQAITSYQAGSALRPDDAAIHYNLGNAFSAQAQYERARACYETTLELSPDHADAHNNLGNILLELGMPAQAAAHFGRGIALRPDFAAAHNNLGAAEQKLGNIVSAINSHRAALRIKPDYTAAHSNLLHTLNYLPDLDPREIFAEHLAFSRRHELPLQAQRLPHANERNRVRRLRVGYISADFRRHSVAYFIEPVLARHDPDAFEIFCYYNHPVTDDYTRRIKQHVAHWRDIAALADAAVAQTVRNDGIDILVDLGGHTSNNRMLMFALKPAPVQVTWLGYPNTTGLAAMDYRITDEQADPPRMTEQFHSEKLCWLPRCFSCYAPPHDYPAVAESPVHAHGYVTFASFNTGEKINGSVISLWAEILHAVPGARLTLKYNSFNDPTIRLSMLGSFETCGIPSDRVALLGKDASQMTHLQRYNAVDISLDPFPYNGTTTICDALWMGVPVITLTGRSHAGRVGTSQLHNIGLSELIADSQEKYLQIAVELANDIPRLDRLRADMRERVATSPLMDAARFTTDLESTYRKMWHAWCDG